MSRYLCVHGHFYQPPRENPWTGEIGLEASAAPFRNWNERITEECYRPNARPVSRAADGTAREMPSNYSRMSFNFGPTLFDWLDRRAPDVSAEIRRADRLSRDWFSGHGSAIAQGYNHMILPLANERDRRTQVLWGIRDFEHRFGRSPEGMWLPETAVDVPTLEVLASLAIRFTILAPQQARRVRPLAGGEWQDVSVGRVDPRRAYAVQLPSGARIAVFFYDGAGVRRDRVRRARGRRRGARAAPCRALGRRPGSAAAARGDGRRDVRPSPQRRRGSARGGARPPARERIRAAHELSRSSSRSILRSTKRRSWKTQRGAARTGSAAGRRTAAAARVSTRTGSRHGALRSGNRSMRCAMRSRPCSKSGGAGFSTIPGWRAMRRSRSCWIRPTRRSTTCSRRVGRGALDAETRMQARRLLDMQRYAMLMFTSCGWFFDDPSGLETTQILRYAARAIELCPEPERAGDRGGVPAAAGGGRSNDPEIGALGASSRRTRGPSRSSLGRLV